MFKIENLNVKVGDKKILNDFNIDIKPGEIHAIMGPNGTGKSTLSKVIMGSKDYIVTNGDITLNNESILKGASIRNINMEGLTIEEARKLLDEAGYTNTGICLSNGLNEFTIRDLKLQGAIVNSLGVGDNIAAAKERVGGVYKLVATIEDNREIPKIKVSNDSAKTINPGHKKVYRFYDKETGYALGDVLTLSDEEIPEDKYTLVHPVETWKQKELTNYQVRNLLVPIFQDGKLVYQTPDIEETKDYCNKEFNTLYEEVKRIDKPHEYYVDLSDKLRELKQELINMHRKQIVEKEKVKVKR